jgi:predicted molibdopterin-dependent oxidoreductase YjgC
MPKLTINGNEIEAAAGTTILEVARDAGIYIPSLCFHPRVGTSGNCRVCVVEVQGLRPLQLSCMLEVKEGMVVSTESARVKAARRVVVELLLASGAHDLSQPDENELARVARHVGVTETRYPALELKHVVDDSHPMLVYDEAKCIRCFRCIRACNSTVVNEVLDMGYRGIDSRVVADADVPWKQSSCVGCGECVQLCPTGALASKRNFGRKQKAGTKRIETLCPYCGVGCRIELRVDVAANRIVDIRGVENAPANEGMLCIKGRYGLDFASSKERFVRPMIKDENGQFYESTWHEALLFVADHLNAIKNAYGSDAIAGLASAKCTNEENYVFQRFMRKEMGTNNVDHCARL